ncbi:hypothetical protein TNCV_2680771 [Trichonephila clavipes]|uniref:Uncharacterized protein n=1 Tax=Trichonephila clavipes TaxID=2585209 RepID=A0A8X6S7W2_TRICX|nr:hypothetical protein TNCV_2680771 [Trichonephila clavipes]
MKYDTRKFFEPVLAALGRIFPIRRNKTIVLQVSVQYISQRELISIEEVPNIDTTLRSVATAQSCGTGQGFNTKQCACFKNNKQFYPKCHHSNPCSNK